MSRLYFRAAGASYPPLTSKVSAAELNSSLGNLRGIVRNLRQVAFELFYSDAKCAPPVFATVEHLPLLAPDVDLEGHLLLLTSGRSVCRKVFLQASPGPVYRLGVTNGRSDLTFVHHLHSAAELLLAVVDGEVLNNAKMACGRESWRSVGHGHAIAFGAETGFIQRLQILRF